MEDGSAGRPDEVQTNIPRARARRRGAGAESTVARAGAGSKLEARSSKLEARSHRQLLEAGIGGWRQSSIFPLNWSPPFAFLSLAIAQKDPYYVLEAERNLDTNRSL